MNVPKNKEKYHLHTDCTLVQGTDSCIPKLSPYSGYCSKWFRKLKHSFIVSRRNEISLKYFRR